MRHKTAMRIGKAGVPVPPPKDINYRAFIQKSEDCLTRLAERQAAKVKFIPKSLPVNPNA